MKARTFFTAALAFFGTLIAMDPRPASAGFMPIVVSGFNQDVVVEAGAVNDPTTHYSGAITATMDNGTAKTFNTWYESGLPGGAGGGLPGAGVFTSAADPSAQFLLAPYTGPNALFLDQDNPTGTLTFATPAAFHELSILTSSGLGTSTSPVLGLTIHFADGTPAISGLSVVSPDWFNNGPAALFAGSGQRGHRPLRQPGCRQPADLSGERGSPRRRLRPPDLEHHFQLVRKLDRVPYGHLRRQRSGRTRTVLLSPPRHGRRGRVVGGRGGVPHHSRQ